MNRISTILSIALLAWPLAACGGAGDPTTTVGAAQLQGSVLELDGQTIRRDGVDIRIVETDDHLVTNADGSFAFPDLEPGWYTLEFDQRRVSALALEESPTGEEGSTEEPAGGEGESAGTGEGAGEEPVSEEPAGEEPSSGGEETPSGEEGGATESKEDEDEMGRPRCEIDGDGPAVVVKVVLENGEVVRWSKSRPGRRFARARLERCVDGSDGDVTGQVRVSWREGGEVQKIEFRACHLDAGAGIVLYLRDPADESGAWMLVDDASADADGCATLRYFNLEGGLPLGKEQVDALAGYAIEIRDADGNCLLKGEIPALPAKVESEGEPEVDLPEAQPPVYGKDRLVPQVDGVFGAVAISHWGERDLDRFEMFAGGLEQGEQVKFQIRDRETEQWVTFATPTAIERDHEEIGYVAYTDTEWHGVLPLHADSVEDLVGLGVRVVRSTGEEETVILIGEIPNLVRE